jgi:hypothetical protein
MLILFLKLGRLSVRLICLLFVQIKKTLILALPGYTMVTKTNSRHRLATRTPNAPSSFVFSQIGNELRCWSISFKDSIFYMWLEDNLVVKYGFEDKEEFLSRAINFFLALKVSNLITLASL